jgi:hypothetical protein
VCVRMSTVRAAVAEAELGAWVAAREAPVAARELTRFLARTDDPVHRRLALHALARTGSVGLTAAKRLRARGGDLGQAAAAWLAAPHRMPAVPQAGPPAEEPQADLQRS